MSTTQINTKTITYTCPVCKTIFTNQNQYIEHILTSHTLTNIDETNELEKLKQILKETYPNYIIDIKDASNQNCKYKITITTDNCTVINQLYGYYEDTLDSYIKYQPNTPDELIKAINEVIDNINTIINSVSQETNDIIDLRCDSYNYPMNSEDENYVFSFKTKYSNEYLQETFMPINMHIDDFSNQILQHIATKIKGYVYIDNSYGEEGFINDMNPIYLYKLARQLGRQVKIEII